MLANGVPILQALEISKDASGSIVLASSIEDAAESVRAGEPLAGPLGASGLFPAEIIEMIAVAEEANQLERVLVQIADTVERRTNRQVDQAVRLMEPIILVIMAVVMARSLVTPPALTTTCTMYTPRTSATKLGVDVVVFCKIALLPCGIDENDQL